MNPIKFLICKIFEQAIEDYQELRSKKITQKSKDGDCYSIKDIELFFDSNWCSDLLGALHTDLTGVDILNKIRRTSGDLLR